jgi:hypothetical protein
MIPTINLDNSRSSPLDYIFPIDNIEADIAAVFAVITRSQRTNTNIGVPDAKEPPHDTISHGTVFAFFRC